ncbi:hypothetical protein [Actinacidiphila rubida]|uniref:Uncharacterized protein n=1 Tax=Actinacidiphila rubida TaxID=310780 RepID=A0A1H8EML8_9ACTN|nr:hypothetical protein [Actinacidiphila rubida]SEN20723.1 hypothetical protein SAMN05216267_1002283 [Actinacidiphila rubida]
MDWGPLTGTALGAVIGIATTLAADHLRAARGRTDADRANRQKLYGDYLAALARTRNTLRIAARMAVPPGERAQSAVESFREGNAYELRYQVAVVAPKDVVEASTAAFRALRDLRNEVEAGAVATDQSYVETRERWDVLLAELRIAMRRDLGRDAF